MKYQIEIFLKPILLSLSNPEYQQRVWLKKLGPEVDSYIEALEVFLEISEAFLNNKEMQTILGLNNLDILRKLTDEIEAFDSTLSDKEMRDVQLILSNPKWHAIQNSSKELYDKL